MKEERSQRYISSDEMIMIMPSGAKWLERANMSEVRFLFSCFRKIKFGMSILFVGPKLRKEMAEAIGVGSRKLSMLERKLVSDGIFIKVNKATDSTGSSLELRGDGKYAMYQLNSDYFWCGGMTNHKIISNYRQDGSVCVEVRNSEETSIDLMVKALRLNNNIIDW